MWIERVLALGLTIQGIRVSAVIPRNDSMVRKVVVSGTGVSDEALKLDQTGTIRSMMVSPVTSGSDRKSRIVAIHSNDVLDEAWELDHDGAMHTTSINTSLVGSDSMVRKVSINAAAVPHDTLKLNHDGTMRTIPVNNVLDGKDSMMSKVAINAAGVAEEALKPEQVDSLRAMSVNTVGHVEDISPVVSRGAGMVLKARAQGASEPDVISQANAAKVDMAQIALRARAGQASSSKALDSERIKSTMIAELILAFVKEPTWKESFYSVMLGILLMGCTAICTCLVFKGGEGDNQRSLPPPPQTHRRPPRLKETMKKGSFDGDGSDTSR